MSETDSGGGSRSARLFEWINANVRWVTVGVVVLTIVGAPLAASRSQDDPNFDPTGELYDTRDLVDDRFQNSSPVSSQLFIVEARGGDALTRDVLLEFRQNSEELRSHPDLSVDLAQQFRGDLGVEVDGVYSLADEVDRVLAGGLENATDADVKIALAEILGDGAVGSPLRDTLSQLSTSRLGTVGDRETVIWESPAFTAAVAVDLTGLGGRDEEGGFGGAGLDAQEYLRDVQSVLQGDQDSFRTLGVAIDGDLTSEEQLAASSPFILLSVVGIMVLVGALLRSYWAAALVAAGLGVTMIWYNAILTALGFEGGMLLGFIAPISVIAFGVDFFVHASGRAREEQVAGVGRDHSYPRGMTLVFPALLLAVVSSAAAFVSNAVSGIEAIIEFGLGTAIALLLAFVMLGVVTPKWLLSVEGWLGDAPLDRGLMIRYKIGFVGMALVAGVVVTMSVVAPIVGFVALAVFVPLFIVVPMRLTRRIYAKAVAAGRPTGTEIKGAGHGFKAAGDIVHFLARWRVVTIPVTVALAVLGVIGFTQVESEFTFSDFFSEDSDFIKSIDLLDTHLGDTSGGGSSFVYVEGDLTQPAVLVALEEAVTELDGAEAAATANGEAAYLSRDLDGHIVVSDNAVDVVRTATASDVVRSTLADGGVELIDADADGLPDNADQIAAIYDLAFREGIVTSEGNVAFPADSVTELLWTDGAGAHGTLVKVGIPTLTEDSIILDARSGLDDAATSLENGSVAAALTKVSVSGDSVTNQDSLAAFTDAMLIALPVALLLCALIAAAFMRSIKYGLAAVTPILLVVGWIYGFMYLFDFKINVVTATIAAIAVGVGIDYSTHFTMRFREEFEEEPSRFPALRRAGEGTGGALAISALSSIIGFSVMAFAPMPIFVTFGTLTAVMIVFSLLVSLLVLPSVLLVVTRSRTGAERQHFLDLTGVTPDEYDPHSRRTAVHRSVHTEVSVEVTETVVE